MWDIRVCVNRLIQVDSIMSAFTVTRGKRYSYHGEAHDYWEMVCITSGVAGIAADDRIFECPKGSVIFHKPNEFHRIWNQSNSNLKYMVITFSTASSFMTENLSNVVMSTSAYAESLISELRVIIEGYDEIDMMPSEFRENKESVVLSKFVNTLELLMYECATIDKIQEPEITRDAKLFTAAVRLMKKNIGIPMKTQQIADELHISLSHLKRIFKNYAFTGIHEYFLFIKIERAKELLIMGKSIYETAVETGFFNQNNFSATFKRETGLPPTVWIKKFSEGTERRNIK